MASSDNLCGGCSLCCKLLGVKEIPKKTDTWCQHCIIGVGCGIYVNRPPTCAAFKCGWLQNQTDKVRVMGPEDRPDKTKVVLYYAEGDEYLFAHCDPSTPDRWRMGKAGVVLRETAKSGNRKVVVKCGEKHWVLDRNGQAIELEMGREDENGHRYGTYKL